MEEIEELQKISNFREYKLVGVYILAFVSVFNQYIFWPTLYPFISTLSEDEKRTTTLFAVELSLFALSQLLSSILSGFLSKKYSLKSIIILLQSINICGAILYCFIQWPFDSVSILLLSRFLSGAQGGMASVLVGYVVTLKRMKHDCSVSLGKFRFARVFFVVPTSLVAAILTFFPNDFYSAGDYSFNIFTIPAIVNFIVQFIGLLFAIFGLRSFDLPMNSDQIGFFKSVGVYLSFSLYFFLGICISTLYYLSPVVLYQVYDWKVEGYSSTAIMISITGILSSLTVSFIRRYLNNYTYFSIVPMIGGICIALVLTSLSTFNVNEIFDISAVSVSFFIVGILFLFYFFSNSHSLLAASFSLIIPREYLGSMVPMTSLLFSLGKIITPIVIEIEYLFLTFGYIYFTLFVISMISLVYTLLLSAHLHSPSPTPL